MERKKRKDKGRSALGPTPLLCGPLHFFPHPPTRHFQKPRLGRFQRQGGPTLSSLRAYLSLVTLPCGVHSPGQSSCSCAIRLWSFNHLLVAAEDPAARPGPPRPNAMADSALVSINTGAAVPARLAINRPRPALIRSLEREEERF
jgi:hypothetical protein